MDDDYIIGRLNKFFQNPADTSLFMENGYIRMNMLYISPYTFCRFKEKLVSMGMKMWNVNRSGIDFCFSKNIDNVSIDFDIYFKGSFLFYKEKIETDEKIEDNAETNFELNEVYHKSIKKNISNSLDDQISAEESNCDKDFRLFCIELDFEPQVNNKEVYNVLYEIESYLKGLDAVFFMNYNVDIYEEIIANPISNSVEYLFKRVMEKKRMTRL